MFPNIQNIIFVPLKIGLCSSVLNALSPCFLTPVEGLVTVLWVTESD